MSFFRYAFNIKKWNADPIQQRMARIFIDVVEGRATPLAIIQIIESQRWAKSEQLERLTHALSLVRVSRNELYREAQEVYRQVGIFLNSM